MKKEELYAHFKALALTQPDLSCYAGNTFGCDEWLARALALVEYEGDAVRIVKLRNILSTFTVATLKDKSAEINTIRSIVLQCLAKLEFSVSPENQGSFIHVGQALDAYKAISQVFAHAKKSLLVVDPYLDGTIITEFMVSVNKDIAISLLSDNSSVRPDLLVACKKWQTQYQAARPLVLKLASDRTLHDRIIISDNEVVWSVTQSFKDFAKRSPASIIRIDTETAQLKVRAYEAIWNDAQHVKT